MKKIIFAISIICLSTMAQAKPVLGAYTSISTRENNLIVNDKMKLPEIQNQLSATQKKSIEFLELVTNGFAAELNGYLAEKYSGGAVMPPKHDCQYNLFSIYSLATEESNDKASLYLYEKCKGDSYQAVEEIDVLDYIQTREISTIGQHWMLHNFWVKLPIPSLYRMQASGDA